MTVEGNNLSYSGVDHHREKNKKFFMWECEIVSLPWSKVALIYIEVGYYGTKSKSLAKHSSCKVCPSNSHNEFGGGSDTLPPNHVCQDFLIVVPGPSGPYTFPLGDIRLGLEPSLVRGFTWSEALLDWELYLAKSSIRPGALFGPKVYLAKSSTWPGSSSWLGTLLDSRAFSAWSSFLPGALLTRCYHFRFR